MDFQQRRFGGRDPVGGQFFGNQGRGRGDAKQGNYGWGRGGWSDVNQGEQGHGRNFGRGNASYGDQAHGRGGFGHGDQGFGRGGRGPFVLGQGRGGRFDQSRNPNTVNEQRKKEEFKGKNSEMGQTKDIRCFRCQDFGHHQVECTNDPVCYKCKQSGHMASECVGLKGHKLKMFGFGIKQGFYSIEIPKAAKASTENVGCIKVLEGVADEKKIEMELQNLIDQKWGWQVKKVSSNEFMVMFPNKQSLDTFSKLSELSTTLYHLKIKVSKSDLDPEATAKLFTVWMKIYGLPSFARMEDVVKEISALAAEPILVDELSLIRTGAVRVKVKCRDPTQLRGFVEIFFNSVGYEIRFIVEGFRNPAKGDGPFGSGKHDHDKKDDHKDDDSEDSDDDGYDGDDTKTEWEKN